jgi:chromosome segregation ATPase
MKQHLDEEKLRNEEAQQRIKDLLDQLADAGKEVGKFKAKHDDMFNSVSSLNARIEELEQHKLHLLEKLKSYGDRGDLSYIVKT